RVRAVERGLTPVAERITANSRGGSETAPTCVDLNMRAAPASRTCLARWPVENAPNGECAKFHNTVSSCCTTTRITKKLDILPFLSPASLLSSPSWWYVSEATVGPG